MNIKIGKLRIVSDSTQFQIVEEKIFGPDSKTPGEKYDWIIGYYSTLSSCLKAIPTRALMKSDCTTLREVIETINGYETLIHAAMKGV